MSEAAAAGERNARLVLAMLLLAYVLNFLDRQMLAILAQPIKADLQLSDTQFGAIGGLAFALLYSLLGVPLGLLADRTSRGGVIAVSLAVWSGFTALCGTAGSYWQLFVFRLGVGIGEAGGVAPSYALIADHFPVERRARALAVFSLGVPLGISAGTLAGALIAARLNWRAAFFVMGAAGLVLAPIVKLAVRDSGKRDCVRGATALTRAFGLLARKPSFWLLASASSLSSLVGYGLALWTPSVLLRSFGLGLVPTALFFASLMLIGGCAGVFGGGWLADRLGTADRRWYAWLPAMAWLISAPTFAAGLMAPSLWVAWPLLLIPNALCILWLAPVSTAVQHLVPRHMRATASASFLLINNLVGLGVGPLLIGGISDALKASSGTDSLRDAAVACTAFYLIAAALMALASRSLRSGWISE